MSIKLISLNIEGHKHLEQRVLPFLQQQQADVICLQEVFEVDLPILAKTLQMQFTYVPMSNVADTSIHMSDALGSIGLAIFSKNDLLTIDKHFYFGKENQIPRFLHAQNPNAMNRCLLTVTIQHQQQMFRIATTHFTWSKNGDSTDLQQEHLTQLFEILTNYPQLILCGDFNAPRGKKTFARLAEKYQDNIPPTIITTLDPSLHKAGKLEYVVDGLFTNSDYIVEKIAVVDQVSDHQAIIAEIKKTS